MKTYDVTDWYWVVGGDLTKVFSSKAFDYVPSDDPTYVAWRADGTNPTNINSEASLGQVLADQQIRPTAVGVLDSYQGALADKAVAIVCFKIEFNHENRIRALEGRPTITVQQFRNAVKALQ